MGRGRVLALVTLVACGFTLGACSGGPANAGPQTDGGVDVGPTVDGGRDAGHDGAAGSDAASDSGGADDAATEGGVDAIAQDDAGPSNSLEITIPAHLPTYTCGRFTVSALDSASQPLQVASDTQITLTGLGYAHAYATLADCYSSTGTMNVTMPAGSSSVDFYLRTIAAETLDLTASANGFTAGTAHFTTTLLQVVGAPDAATVPLVAGGEGWPPIVKVQHGKLFVVDSGFHRVLVWNSPPAAVGPPDVVLGQFDTSSSAPNAGKSTTNAVGLWQPMGVAYDGTRVFVADSQNFRVLVWNALPTSDGQPADFALGPAAGATNLTSRTGGCSASAMSLLGDVSTDGTRLYVADTNNNRVLAWNAIPTSPTAADFALGRPAGASNLTSCASGVSATAMFWPTTAFVAGAQLFVSDSVNSRVLVWNSLPASITSSTVPAADFALGQPSGAANLTSSAINNGGVSGGSMAVPKSVMSDGTRLFVADVNNHRVLVWNALPTSVVAADFALGQPDLTTNTTAATAANTLPAVTSAWSTGSQIFAADGARTAVWNSLPTASGSSADFALGQPAGSSNLTSSSLGGPPSGGTMYYPQFVMTDGTRLFVADPSNHRVLVWNSLPTGDGQSADFALGYPAGATNLTDNSSGTASATTMSSPAAVATDGTRLFVADGANHRVLVWNQIPSAPTPADFALGQPAGASNLTSHGANAGGITAGSMSGPSAVAVSGAHLFVADTNNHRVLVWDTSAWSASQSAPVDAAFALGQPDLTSGTANNGGLSATSLRSPQGVFTDGTRLIVADTRNNRVLVWSAVPSSSVAADVVVGQADFASATAALSQAGLNGPQHAVTDGKRLFVADSNSNRVMVWQPLPAANGADASVVLGQVDFTSKDADRAGAMSAVGVFWPYGVWADPTRLFIADSGNHRIVIVPTEGSF